MVSEKGYKQTEIGLIPEDWNVFELSEVVIFLDGQRRPIKSSERIPGEFPYYGASGIIDYVNNYIFDDDLILLGEDGENILSRNLPLAFKVSGKIWVNNHAHVLKPKEGYDISFLTDYLESLDYSLLNSGTAQPKLNKQACLNIKIACPGINEQTAIANALSDMDALIAQTEKLIEKKKAIKQGVMQELLRPKEGWVTKKIPEVCWFQEGPGVRKHQFTQYGVKLLNGTNIQFGKLELDNTDKFISNEEAFGWYSHFLVDDQDILIACSGVSIDKFHEKVTIADKHHLPLCMNTSTMRFKVDCKQLDKSYFIQFLKSKNFKEQISGKATGSAQLNFGPSHVKMIEISLPNIEEQIEIGKILDDFENQIIKCDTKLQKLKFQKQGMMQALLTGKIRLV